MRERGRDIERGGVRGRERGRVRESETGSTEGWGGRRDVVTQQVSLEVRNK